MTFCPSLTEFCFSAEYDHVFSPEEQRKLAEAATEEVPIETNAAYGLRSEDVLFLEEQREAGLLLRRLLRKKMLHTG